MSAVSVQTSRRARSTRRPRGVWAAPWQALCRWAHSRDLDRIDVSVQAGVHLLLGLGLLFLPERLRMSRNLEVLLSGELLGLPLSLVWGSAFLLSGIALVVVCRWPYHWTLQHLGWGLALPLVTMWIVGLLLVVPTGQGNVLAVVPFGGLFLWHLTTAVRLWARTT